MLTGFQVMVACYAVLFVWVRGIEPRLPHRWQLVKNDDEVLNTFITERGAKRRVAQMRRLAKQHPLGYIVLAQMEFSYRIVKVDR